MPKDSIPVTFVDWRSVIDTVDSYSVGAKSATAQELVDQLRVILARSQDLEQRQRQLAAERQEVTRQLRTALAEGRSLAGRIRLATSATFGEGERAAAAGADAAPAEALTAVTRELPPSRGPSRPRASDSPGGGGCRGPVLQEGSGRGGCRSPVIGTTETAVTASLPEGAAAAPTFRAAKESAGAAKHRGLPQPPAQS